MLDLEVLRGSRSGNEFENFLMGIFLYYEDSRFR